MDDNTRKQLIYEENRKSGGISYLLWFFLGGLGAHRFYLGKKGSGAAQASLALFGWIPLFMGWAALSIWWIIDAFLIPGMVRDENIDLIRKIDERVGPSLPEHAQPATRGLDHDLERRQRLTEPARAPVPGSRADEIRKLSS